KTTGSEASLFCAGQGERSRRLPTYRPMNKVSIVEQKQALQTAHALGAHVFVWECMALRPDYVDQVQHQWTHDDLATITNAHADHEDVQGPTGRDVAEAISGFIPTNSFALSTEQAMRPVLEQTASERNTLLKTLSADEIQAVPADLLENFDYQEHPSNLALALHVARELGCDHEEAGYLMATHSVADLGALRTAPPMRVVGRRLSLSNGMSANQPAGLLNNWVSCGFTEADALGHPNRCFVSIVNNRQDRPQRSRAFARCLVRQLPAHRHILMGSNLQGLLNMIKEELEEHLSEWTLPDSPKATEQRLRVLRKQLCLTSPGPLLRSTALLLGLRSTQMANIAEEMDNRIAQVGPDITTYREARVQLEPLQESLNQLAHQIEGALFHNSRERRAVIKDAQEQWLACAAEALLFASVAKACALTSSPEHRLALLKRSYTALFLRHVLLLPGNPTADQVIQFTAQSCPPGAEIHAMAVQNIHGPGRSLATAIQTGCRVLELCEELSSDSSDAVGDALRKIRSNSLWTIPLCHEVLRTIYAMPAQPELAGERDLTVNSIHQRLETCEQALKSEPRLTKLLGRISHLAENTRLPFRVIRNRRRADRILDALCKGLVSRRRAELELGLLVEEDHQTDLLPDPPGAMLG
ncbi:MAG: hypothetical protein VXW32_09240, partial [Myxococcota bacterium]|nr:hypothetical protein [Myxococcota bacterium]